MAQNEKFDEKYEIKKTYNASLCNSKLETVKRMFGKQLTIEQRLDQEKAKKTMDNTNSYYVFDNQKKKNNKLQVRLSKIAAVFSNRYRLAKVIKNMSRRGNA